jgi:NAD(P)-dependent dehydrogenase (short-subunit alcohol dehydrogenase family)
VIQALGEHDDLLVVALDVTSPSSAEAATRAAVERFGRIDVLVNNAGNFYAGFFEEFTPEQIDAQLAANLLGPMNVTRAVLPVMRKQRSGHVVTITSTAGIVGGETASINAASKFGDGGWMEALTPEVAPFGIKTTLVEPGFFRTELLEPASTTWAELSIEDYAERNAAIRPALGSEERAAARRPGQARRRARADRRPGRAASSVGRRRRRRRHHRAEGAGPVRTGRRVPRPVDLARTRCGRRRLVADRQAHSREQERDGPHGDPARR